jgi:hypothetical protein
MTTSFERMVTLFAWKGWNVRRTPTLCGTRTGKVTITDGPYAETKEQIGGLLLLEAIDLNHAVQLMSKHPGIRVGALEIRTIEAPSCARASELGKP